MPKRRKNGEGTIYQDKNGLWRYEMTLGYDADNKRIRKVLSSKNLDELQKKINELKYMNDRNLVSAPSQHTVASWIDFWLKTYKKDYVKRTTYDMYYGVNERFITPQFGKYKLDKLNTIMIQQFINNLHNQKLSVSYIKKIYLTLNQALQKAVDLKIISVNPCVSIELPKAAKQKAVAFSSQEQKIFLKECTGKNTYENLFIFGFNTGMRIGEMLALTWDNIENDIISVRYNLTEVRNYNDPEKKTEIIINDSTKTESSVRTIPMNKAAKEVVQRQRENNRIGSPFVFYSEAGTPVRRRNAYRAFQNMLKSLNIETPLTLHSMRHSFATRLLEKGADIKTISELLGHKSIQITLDTYSHVSGDLKNKTIALLEEN